MADPTFGRRLKAARKAAGLTQQGMSDLLGVTRGRVAAYETALYDPPLVFVASAARLLNVSADYLLGLKEHKTE